MLTIQVPEKELFDETTSEFFTLKRRTLRLQHSLVSLSKWEAITNKPFLSEEKMSDNEALLYIKCMTITQNIPDITYKYIPASEIRKINDYIELSMTATTFVKTKNSINKEVVTSELIYYWLVALGIPFECQKWHLNRLLTLINICNIKNQPKKPMSRREIMERNKAINAERKRKMQTRG